MEPARAQQQPTDEALMLRYRDGDSAAFETLYKRHKGGLYRYLLRQCQNSAVSEELFQDIWMNIIRTRTNYQVSAKFTTFLYRLAHNRLIDHYRKDSKGIPVSFEDDDCPDIEAFVVETRSNPENRFAAKLQMERFVQLLSELPEAQREAFLLYEEADMSVEEIAVITNTGRETAKSRLRYALAKLRQGLKDFLE
jgi:RNA polymerase sigma-70 factor (ECF subfamily)